jgi:hypothetical protein
MPFESARAELVRGLAAMGLGQVEQSHSEFMKARAVFARNSCTTK